MAKTTKTTSKKTSTPVKERKHTDNTLGIVLLATLTMLSAAAFFAVMWYRNVYGDTGFDSVIYTLFGGLGGTQDGLMLSFFAKAILPSIAVTIALTLLCFPPKAWKRKSFRGLIRTFSVLLCLFLLVSAAFNVGLVDYIRSRTQLTELYENEYVDPNTVKIEFPEEKRNLIYIYLESMESSYLSKEQGGAMDTCLIPELYNLANEYTNFSHNKDVGGLVEVTGTSWTVGAMVGQTSGVPLFVPNGISDWQNGYGKDGEFLPGLTTLNNILADAGYSQTLMVGSDVNFGGRKTYFGTHGVENIHDVYTARKDGIIPPNYFEWWGMEDLHLFEYAKQKLTELAQSDDPFYFTAITVDTHHIGGYNCVYCGSDYEETYENAIACSSKQVTAFVRWIQAQDFYENTTIIITGDHFSMDSGYFSRNVAEGYVRHGYNCIINAAVTTKNTHNRHFSSLDMFPTTLAAIGCTIEGNRLGFGANLYSSTPTLIEKYGYAAFNDELSKRTDYYAENFYGESN